MDAVFALQRARRSSPWRTGVWGLRLEAVGLVVIVIGLLIAIASHDAGLWTVVAGLVVLAAGALTTVLGMVAAYREFGEDRPSDDLLRRALARDVFGLHRSAATTTGAPKPAPPTGAAGTP